MVEADRPVRPDVSVVRTSLRRKPARGRLYWRPMPPRSLNSGGTKSASRSFTLSSRPRKPPGDGHRSAESRQQELRTGPDFLSPQTRRVLAGWCQFGGIHLLLPAGPPCVSRPNTGHLAALALSGRRNAPLAFAARGLCGPAGTSLAPHRRSLIRRRRRRAARPASGIFTPAGTMGCTPNSCITTARCPAS